MATKTLITLKLTTLLSLLIIPLLLSHTAASIQDEENEDPTEYVLDSFYSNNGTRKSRFLASAANKIKKGAQCDVNSKKKARACNGVYADKGVSLLYCCKKHCRDVLGDRNNCGRCGRKCRLNERCCGGVCRDVMSNKSNCGKCDKKCRKGVKCEYGYCGYA